jgi:glycosyltransferase involved in cell wall biosynthesis
MNRPVALISNLLHFPAMVGYNRYSVSLTRELQTLSEQELVWVPLPSGVHPAIRAQLPGRVAEPVGRGLLPKTLDWQGTARRLRPCLWHVLTDTPVPCFVREPVVVTCHGLPRFVRHRHMLRDGHLPGGLWDYQDYPNTFGAKRAMAFHHAETFIALRRATAIIADSEYVRWELVNKFGIRAEKIHVVHLAADAVFKKPRTASEVEAVRAKLGLPARFAVAVASYSRTKNTDGLLRLARNLAAVAGAPPLVLVAPAGKKEYFTQEAESLGLVPGKSVWLLEKITDDELACVYRAADVFVNLAWEESFGLPIVEAMAGGTPVVASDKTAVPEIVGDGGLVVDPRDDGAVARAVLRVLTEADLRLSLQEKAARRAAEFSWVKAAKAVVKVYQSVAQCDIVNPT